MSGQERLGVLRGHARPGAALRKKLGKLYGPGTVHRMDAMLDDTVTIDALAGLLDQAMQASVSKDGRLDLKDMAVFMMKEMRRLGK